MIEVWSPIEGTCNDYHVSNMGRVYSSIVDKIIECDPVMWRLRKSYLGSELAKKMFSEILGEAECLN